MSSGSSSAQTIHPSSNLAHKRHILGMSTSLQNDFYCPKLCRLNCTLITSTPPKILLHRAVFWGFAKPLHGNSEISHGCMLQRTNSCLLFQTWSKSVQNKCLKGRVVLVTKNKTRLAPFGKTPGAISYKFFAWVCTVVPHLCFRFHPNMFRFEGVITE